MAIAAGGIHDQIPWLHSLLPEAVRSLRQAAAKGELRSCWDATCTRLAVWSPCSAVYSRGPQASSLVLLADEELGEALRGSKVRGLSNVPEEACTVPKVCWRAPIRATAPPLTPNLVAGEVRPHELCWVTVWQV